MLKRIYEAISLVLFSAGICGVILSFYFLYVQRFIEAIAAGFISLLIIRGGILILRLLTARASIDDSHRRILKQLEETSLKDVKKRTTNHTDLHR